MYYLYKCFQFYSRLTEGTLNLARAFVEDFQFYSRLTCTMTEIFDFVTSHFQFYSRLTVSLDDDKIYLPIDAFNSIVD